MDYFARDQIKTETPIAATVPVGPDCWLTVDAIQNSFRSVPDGFPTISVFDSKTTGLGSAAPADKDQTPGETWKTGLEQPPEEREKTHKIIKDAVELLKAPDKMSDFFDTCSKMTEEQLKALNAHLADVLGRKSTDPVVRVGRRIDHETGKVYVLTIDALYHDRLGDHYAGMTYRKDREGRLESFSVFGRDGNQQPGDAAIKTIKEFFAKPKSRRD